MMIAVETRLAICNLQLEIVESFLINCKLQISNYQFTQSKAGKKEGQRAKGRDHASESTQAQTGTAFSGERSSGSAHCRGAGRCFRGHSAGDRPWPGRHHGLARTEGAAADRGGIGPYPFGAAPDEIFDAPQC